MEKIESPREFPKEFSKPEGGGGGGGFSSKLARFSVKFFAVTKFILGICTLPFVYGVTVGFLDQLGFVPEKPIGEFWAGVITMIIVYLFVWEPTIVYTKGQKIMEAAFSYLKPLVRVAPYLLPIYTIIVFLLYLLFAYIFKSLADYFMFLFGFTIVLHLIFSAKTMRGKKEDFLKGNYIFGFSLIYIINIGLLSFCFSVLFEKFSFVNFCNQSFLIAKGIFGAIIKQLFL